MTGLLDNPLFWMLIGGMSLQGFIDHSARTMCDKEDVWGAISGILDFVAFVGCLYLAGLF
jgi:hypothetical protein